MQPAEVEDQQLLDFGGCQASLGRGWHVLGDVVDGLIEAVDDTWGDGIQAMGLAADHDRRDHEHRRARR